MLIGGTGASPKGAEHDGEEQPGLAEEAGSVYSALSMSGVRTGGSCWTREMPDIWIPKAKVANSHFDRQIVAFWCSKDLQLWG